MSCTTIPNLVAKRSNIQEIWKKQLRFEDLTPHSDLDFEDRKPTFSHDTPGHDDAPSYKVWFSGWEDICSKV